MDVSWITAADLQAALRGRELSAVEVLEAVIERSEAVNPKINALALPLFDRARDAAARADRALARGEGGPLCGIPVTIKDSQWLAGVRCANGSKTLEDFVPRETCAAVTRLEDAGAVIFAKTTCPEFSYLGVTFSEIYGTTANPWDLTRTPGGSSGGAAAAVAAGLGPLSLGGDGGGSIRIPAAFCGLVGFKPSFGVVPREPCFPAWKTLVSYGPMARSVADARLMFQEIAGFHSHDRHSTHAHDDEDDPIALRGLRLVASEDLGFAPIDEDVRAAYRQLLEKLEAAGVELIFDNPGLRSSAKTWATTAFADAWVSDREELEHRGEILGQSTRASLEFGGKFALEDYLEAQYEREKIHRAYARLFDRTGAAALLTPTLGCEAFGHGHMWPPRIGDTEIELPWVDWGGFLYDANLAGFPACALPMGFGDEGLPVSLQVIAPRAFDMRLLSIAERLEEAVAWPGRYPDLAAPEEAERPAAMPMVDEVSVEV